MKVFVTGATGFIGKHLVNKLISEGIDVTINLYGEEVSPFEKGVGTYRIYENQASNDIDFLKREKFDGVIHLASLYLKDHSPNDVVNLMNSNIRFASYILECASRADIKWFINTGTFWQNYKDQEYSPVNLYAATKQAFEAIAQYYIETQQIKFTTIRLSDTYGPGDTRPKIFNLWEKIRLTGENLDMSPGEQIFDISFIDDIAEAYSLLANHLQNNDPRVKCGDVFAVKARNRYSLIELAAVFEKVTACQLKINWGKRDYREREVMIPWENGKVVPEWNPKTSINDGIKKLIG